MWSKFIVLWLQAAIPLKKIFLILLIMKVLYGHQRKFRNARDIFKRINLCINEDFSWLPVIDWLYLKQKSNIIGRIWRTRKINVTRLKMSRNRADAEGKEEENPMIFIAEIAWPGAVAPP